MTKVVLCHNDEFLHNYHLPNKYMIDWLNNWIEVYAILALFQPCNGDQCLWDFRLIVICRKFNTLNRKSNNLLSQHKIKNMRYTWKLIFSFIHNKLILKKKWRGAYLARISLCNLWLWKIASISKSYLSLKKNLEKRK